MRSYRLIPLLCLVLAASSLSIRTLRADPAPAAIPPTRVAIVNPANVFAQMKETAVLREKLKVKQKELGAMEMEKRAEIEQMIKDRDANYNPKHPKYLEACKAIDIKKGEFQAWGVTTKAGIERDQKLMLKDLYDKIEAAVAKVAQQRGIDLVIADGRQDITNIEEVPSEDLRRILNTRNVIYSTKAVDITETVIAVLDQQYAAAGAGGTGPAVAPPLPTPGSATH